MTYYIGTGTNRKIPCIQLMPDSTMAFGGVVRLPVASIDYQFCYNFQMSTSDSSKNVYIKFEAFCPTTGESFAADSADVSSSQAISCRNDALMGDTVRNSNFRIPSANVHNNGQLCVFHFSRIGANASDTHGGEMYISKSIWFEPV